MELQFQCRGAVSIAIMPPRMAMADAPAMRKTINRYVEDVCARIVFDMSAVEFVDSSGLSVLVSALKTARAQGGEVVLLSPSERILSLIMLTRLHELFAMFEQQESAMEHLSPKAEPAA